MANTYTGYSIGAITIPDTGASIVTIEKDNPDPPPEKLTQVLNCSKDRAREMLTAKAGGLLVNVTTDGQTPELITSVTYP